MYMKDGFHPSGKGAAVFADELSAAEDSGMGSIIISFWSKHCENWKRRGLLRGASSRTKGH